MKVTEAMRYEVISATGLCLNPRCKAHDSVVAKIWKYKSEAYDTGYDHANDVLQHHLPLGLLG